MWPGLSVVSSFIGVRPGGRPFLLGSLRCAIVVVGFIRSRRVHSGAPLGSAGVAGVRPGVRRVHQRSLGS